jgi:hypothetical protein
MTLENVTLELMESNSNLKVLHKDNNDILEYLELSQSTFREGFLELLDFFKGSSLKDLEEKREDELYKQQVLDALENLEPKESIPEKDEESPSLTGIGLILAGLLGVTVGVVSGWLKAIKGFYKLLTPASIQKAVANTLKGIQNIFRSIVTVIRTQITAVSLAITKQFNVLKNTLGKIFGTGSRLGKAVSIIGARVSGLVKIFTDAGEIIKSLLAGPISKVGEVFKLIRGYFTSFSKIVGVVARIVSRLFAPLIVIMTIWDTVKGAIEGFEKEGIIGGIKGAITGFFNSLIFGPLDMIKDAVAWVLGAFGFDKAEEVLKNFSFSKLFTDLVDGFFTLVTDIVGWVKKQFGFTGEGMPSFTDIVLGLMTLPYNLLKTVVGKIAGFFGFDQVKETLEGFDFKKLITDVIDSMTEVVTMAADWIIGKFKSAGETISDIVPDMDATTQFLKSVLQNVLPVADSSGSWYDINNLVAAAIPDSIYEFAGIDPKTGEIINKAKQPIDESDENAVVPQVIVGKPTVIRSEDATNNMEQTQNENQELRSQQATAAQPTINSNSTVNNTSSSNTTVVRPQIMPTRQPNSPSETMWSGMPGPW